VNDASEHVRASGGIQELAQVLSRAEHRVTRELSRILEGEGCSVEQWRALQLLAGGSSRSMSEIADFTLLPAPTLTRLIDRMVADNLAYRKADPTDGCRVLVLITPRGQRLQERLTQRIEQEQAALLADTDEAEVVRLTALLAASRSPEPVIVELRRAS
jgi:DNA-binding MarR family transcriptional regulator